jgi:hypothetical protein
VRQYLKGPEWRAADGTSQVSQKSHRYFSIVAHRYCDQFLEIGRDLSERLGLVAKLLSLHRERGRSR